MKIPLTTVEDAGLAVRALRRHAGIRIDDFALTAQVSKQFMTDMENGKPTVQMGRVLTLLHKLGARLTLELPDAALPQLIAARERRERRNPPAGRESPSDA